MVVTEGHDDWMRQMLLIGGVSMDMEDGSGLTHLRKAIERTGTSSSMNMTKTVRVPLCDMITTRQDLLHRELKDEAGRWARMGFQQHQFL